MLVSHPFAVLLDVDGDGGGSTSGAVNGSSTPVALSLDGYSGAELVVHRLLVTIEDGAAAVAEAYGAVAALTNGVELEWLRHGKTIDLLSGVPVKHNAGWARVADSVESRNFATGNSLVQAAIEFTKWGGGLALAAGDKVIARVNDDLTGLVAHTFTAQGLVARRDASSANVDLARFFGS